MIMSKSSDFTVDNVQMLTSLLTMEDTGGVVMVEPYLVGSTIPV